MRIPRLIFPVVVLSLVPQLLYSQLPSLTPERHASIMEVGRLMNDPVAFVLKHRQELALTDLQMASLTKLSAALRDSSTARAALLVRLTQTNSTLPALVSAMEWSGPVNEEAIRDAVRQQSVVQAEVMIAGARDRRAVGAILTPEQHTRLPELQMAEMMKAARGGTQ